MPMPSHEIHEPVSPAMLAGVAQMAVTGDQIIDDNSVVLSVDSGPAPYIQRNNFV